MKNRPVQKNITLYFLDNLAESFLMESFSACSEVELNAPPVFLAAVFCAATFTVSVLVESITPVVLVFESITVVDVESIGFFVWLQEQEASDNAIAAIKAAETMFFIMCFH